MAWNGICMVHIGSVIRQEMINQRRPVSWLAEELCCDRSTVYKMLHRESVDSYTLFRISQLLSVNFFKYYTEELGFWTTCGDFFHKVWNNQPQVHVSRQRKIMYFCTINKYNLWWNHGSHMGQGRGFRQDGRSCLLQVGFQSPFLFRRQSHGNSFDEESQVCQDSGLQGYMFYKR